MAKEHGVGRQLAAKPDLVFIIGLTALIAAYAMIQAIAQLVNQLRK